MLRWKRFYTDWYRPDLQAIIVVGDVDVNDMEQKIREIFGDIPAAGTPVSGKTSRCRIMMKY